VFFKEFLDPIEQVILDRNGNISYLNVESARNFGAELELRLSLDLIADGLDAWLIGLNAGIISSEVTLSPEQLLNATSSQRALAGQAPFVVNASLGFAPPESGFSVFAYYNVAGRRIEDVGRLGLPDIYSEPFNSLDLTLRWELAEDWSLKLAARNLLYQSNEETQGDITVTDTQRGASVSVGLGWAF
jgi:outer membrane receptor protein involved in Fe transport